MKLLAQVLKIFHHRDHIFIFRPARLDSEKYLNNLIVFGQVESRIYTQMWFHHFPIKHDMINAMNASCSMIRYIQ
jgi:hypothetical protein